MLIVFMFCLFVYSCPALTSQVSVSVISAVVLV